MRPVQTLTDQVSAARGKVHSQAEAQGLLLAGWLCTMAMGAIVRMCSQLHGLMVSDRPGVDCCLGQQLSALDKRTAGASACGVLHAPTPTDMC